jgi:hypothetical protein
MQLKLGGTGTCDGALLRDLAVDSLRFELHGVLPGDLSRSAKRQFEAHIPGLDLYLRCKAWVARTYEGPNGGDRIRGAALRMMDLDPATRGHIRSLYPAGTPLPEDLG